MFGLWHGLMGLWMLIPVILVVLVIYLIVRSTGNGSNSMDNQRNREKDALEILNERYAKGELNKEEYKDKKESLRDDK